MKSTGIVRRLDDLGRIVIPKEIRGRLRLTEGSPMELYIDGSSVILKPYSPLDLNGYIVQVIRSSMSKLGIDDFAIYDDYERKSGAAAYPTTLPEEILLASPCGPFMKLSTNLWAAPIVGSDKVYGYIVGHIDSIWGENYQEQIGSIKAIAKMAAAMIENE